MDGTTEGSAELRPLQRIALSRENVAGVEHLVAMKGKGIAVKLVRTALADHVDDCAGV